MKIDISWVRTPKITLVWFKMFNFSYSPLNQVSKLSFHTTVCDKESIFILLCALITSLILDCQKIAKLRQSCDSFCVQNLQETTIVYTIATDNFCLHYCNWNHFKHYSNCQLLHAILQLATFLWNNNFCMDYCNHYD